MSGVARALARHAGASVATVALLLATLLAGIGLLGLSGGFLTAAALTFGVVGGFNLFLPSAGIRALTLARIVCRYGEKVVGHGATLRLARDLRVWLFGRLLALSPGQLARLRTGDVLARLLGDIDAVDGVLVRAIGPLLALGVATLGLVAFAVAMDPVAGLWIALATALGTVASWGRVARGGQVAEDGLAARRADLRAGLHELYEGAPDLAALGATSGGWQDLDLASSRLAQDEGRRRRRLADAVALQGIAGAIAWTGLFWLACAAAADGRLPPAHAAGLAFAALALTELLPGMALAWQALQGARASMRRIQTLSGQTPAIIDPPRPRPLPARGALEFASVDFAWPGGRPILADTALRLEPGERVAIRGDSGCGKSSLAALALRLVDPVHGAVRWGGIDLRDAAQADWHARLAWLPQEAPVFAGTLAQNLRMGSPDASDALLEDVLAGVRLDQWVRAAGGLDAWIGEGGATVSAGQARRIALARALLRPVPLLVLDEPTEGLDQDTADAVMQALTRLWAGRSVLLVSHARLPPGAVHRELLLRDGRLSPLPRGA